MSDFSEANGFQLARFVLRLAFVILTSVGCAVSALLIALAFAIERLYSVPALPWALATLAFPASGLAALALSTRLARFISGNLSTSAPVDDAKTL